MPSVSFKVIWVIQGLQLAKDRSSGLCACQIVDACVDVEETGQDRLKPSLGDEAEWRGGGGAGQLSDIDGLKLTSESIALIQIT